MNLYIDFDNVIVNSSEIVMQLLNEKYKTNKKYSKLKKYDFSDLYPNISYWDIEKSFEDDEFFKRIKKYSFFDYVISVLDPEKDNLYIVTIGTEDNLVKKLKWSDTNIDYDFSFRGILNNGHNDKSSVDMSDGIMIDDNIECLRSCNAKIKILFDKEEKWEWSKADINDDVYIVHNWEEIYSIINFFKREGDIF